MRTKRQDGSSKYWKRSRNIVHGFTLIELLVVVGIIALLIGILVPSIGKARAQAKRTRCLANLNQIGQAIRSYMNEYHDYYPPMAPMPTLDLVLYGPDKARPSMPKCLGPYVGQQVEVFHCPSDRITASADPNDPIPSGKTTYFEWEGSSYEPRVGLSIIKDGYWRVSKEDHPLGKDEMASADMKSEEVDKLTNYFENLTLLDLIHDYEDFHDEGGGAMSRMALFADFHSGPLGK